jgi:hypothetical protein
MAPVLLLFALTSGPAPELVGEGAAVELRALRAYLGLYEESRKVADASQELSVELGLDLRARLDRFLDQRDLPAAPKEEGIWVYLGLARAACVPTTEGPSGFGTAGPESLSARRLFLEVLSRAEEAGLDPLGAELEMLQSPEVGFDAHETYARLARRMGPLLDRAPALPAEEEAGLRAVFRRLLGDPAWPKLKDGQALPAAARLLAALGGGERRVEAGLFAAKLHDWTARLLEAEARGGEQAQEAGIIHLYRTLELVGRDLDQAQIEGALAGLSALAPPSLSEGASPQGPAFSSVEVGEVRLPAPRGSRPSPGSAAAGGELIPPLAAEASSDRKTRYLLAPGKSYQVRLVCGREGTEPPALFRVLAKAGLDGRLVLPRWLPPGMVPITDAETGRVAFLADQRPWSIRRFLLALQRSWTALGTDLTLPLRLCQSTALREIPLSPKGEPSFAALVGLLSAQPPSNRLEETFWVEAGDEAGRAAAFEIAGAVLTANSGLRDSALSLPTVAQANRLFEGGAWFGIEEPCGLFNATRLVPEPKELGERARYGIRTVWNVPSP